MKRIPSSCFLILVHWSSKNISVCRPTLRAASAKRVVMLTQFTGIYPSTQKKESNEIFLTRKRLEANSELLLASNYTFNYIGTIIRLYFQVGDKCEKSGIWIIHNTKGYNNYVDFTEHRLNREMAHHYASRNFVGQTSLRENFRAPDSWLIINIYTLKYWPFDSVCRKWRI